MQIQDLIREIKEFNNLPSSEKIQQMNRFKKKLDFLGIDSNDNPELV